MTRTETRMVVLVEELAGAGPKGKGRVRRYVINSLSQTQQLDLDMTLSDYIYILLSTPLCLVQKSPRTGLPSSSKTLSMSEEERKQAQRMRKKIEKQESRKRKLESMTEEEREIHKQGLSQERKKQRELKQG